MVIKSVSQYPTSRLRYAGYQSIKNGITEFTTCHRLRQVSGYAYLETTDCHLIFPILIINLLVKFSRTESGICLFANTSKPLKSGNKCITQMINKFCVSSSFYHALIFQICGCTVDPVVKAVNTDRCVLTTAKNTTTISCYRFFVGFPTTIAVR